MATGLKTVEYAFPLLASLTDATLTAMTQITAYLPESSKVFKSVTVTFTSLDILTATGGNLSSVRADLSVGGAAATSINQNQTWTASGENNSVDRVFNFTSHFVTNWASGTSKTVDLSVLVDQTSGTTLGQVNVCATLRITYEYDDSSTTHVKTVYIPLDATTTFPATTKGGASPVTIPALDTYLPEDSKTYRQIYVVIQGLESGLNTVDFTISMEIDSLGAFTSGNFERALASERWYRLTWIAPAFTTNATHSFYHWNSQTKGYHPQIYMVVTYEFDSTTTTAAMNSLLLPIKVQSPMAGNTSSDYTRASVELWIEEPATITLQSLALLFFYHASTTITGLNARIGTGSFVAYTDNATLVTPTNALMIRNDSAFTLSRGKNVLTADFYRTGSTKDQLAMGLSGVWIVNYTSGIAAEGISAHNHTVVWNLGDTSGTGASAGFGDYREIAAVAPGIPETAYFISNVAGAVVHSINNTGKLDSISLLGENLAAETGPSYFPLVETAVNSDAEMGPRFFFGDTDLIKKYPTDPNPTEIDLETARRWYVFFRQDGPATNAFTWVDLYFTYHAITWTVAGTVSGYTGGGSGIVVDIFDATTGQKRGSATTSAGGGYTFTWYDNVNNVFAAAQQAAGYVGRSDNSVAT